MASLPIFQTSDKDLTLLQNKWSSVLNPVIANPSISTSILKNVQLTTGSNTINHLLGRILVGWRLVRVRGPATLYDTQDANPMKTLTLLITSDADVSVDLEVF